MEWKSVNEKPRIIHSKYGIKENDNLLVWVSEHKTYAKGRYYEYSDGSYSFCADGYNGKWNITHWVEVNPPK